MDFFNILSILATGHPYENALFIYPPFTGLIFGIFKDMLPYDLLAYATTINPASVIDTHKLAIQIRDSQSGMIILLMFLIIGLGTMVFIISTLKTGSKNEKLLFITLTVFSAPMLFELERSNTILYALIFILGFFACKNSSIPLVRELALLFLACAAGLKVYPALFGLILLRERRWKDTLKAIIYGLIIFFVPFLFFGGFEIIPKLVTTLYTGSLSTFDRGLGHRVDLTSLIRIIGYVINVQDKVIIDFGVKFSLVMSLIAIPACMSIKKNWKAITILCCMIILTPAFNYYYALIYMIPAIVFFLNQEKYNKIDCIFAIIFSLIYCPIYLGIMPIDSNIPLTVSNFLQNLMCIGLYIILIIEGYYQLIKRTVMQNNYLGVLK
jgi:Protein of unknown function (DUF2029).